MKQMDSGEFNVPLKERIKKLDEIEKILMQEKETAVKDFAYLRAFISALPSASTTLTGQLRSTKVR